MGINSNAKKLTSLSRLAVKGLNEGKTVAWFLIEAGSGKNLFYVDKKISSASKFKDPAIVKKFLEKLKITGADKIDKKAPLVAGTLVSAQGTYELVIALKKNGGGKSSLKAALKDSTIQKLLKPASIVKRHSISDVEQAMTAEEVQEQVEAGEIEAEIEAESKALKLSENEKKALKIHLWSMKNLVKLYSLPGIEANEDFFQTAMRRMKKFQKAKMYDLFHSALLSSHPLQKYVKALKLTKADLPGLIKACERKLDQVEESKARGDDGETLDLDAAAEAAAEELMDEEFLNDFSEFESQLEEIGFSDTEIADIISAFGIKNKSGFDDLFTVCGNSKKELNNLLKAFGHGNWSTMVSILTQIELL